jgi:hypothetical protein
VFALTLAFLTLKDDVHVLQVLNPCLTDALSQAKKGAILESHSHWCAKAPALRVIISCDTSICKPSHGLIAIATGNSDGLGPNVHHHVHCSRMGYDNRSKQDRREYVTQHAVSTPRVGPIHSSHFPLWDVEFILRTPTRRINNKRTFIQRATLGTHDSTRQRRVAQPLL